MQKWFRLIWAHPVCIKQNSLNTGRTINFRITMFVRIHLRTRISRRIAYDQGIWPFVVVHARCEMKCKSKSSLVVAVKLASD